MDRRTAISAFAGSVAACAAGWFLVEFYIAMRLRAEPEIVCRTNLRLLYVASRKAPQPLRGTEEGAKYVLNTSFLITEQECAYIYPRADRKMMLYIGPNTEALLCRNDPDYGHKIGLAVAQTLDFEPSYKWAPDADTLAYCPYHKLAISTSGEIETR